MPPSSFTPPNTNLKNEPENENPIKEIIKFSVIALLIVIPIRLYIAQPFVVSGDSMLSTFYNGEYLIVDEISYRFNDPKRGDVVIFRYPNNPSQYFIKRIIGLPGETIQIEDNQVTITSEEFPESFVLKEPYIAEMTKPTRTSVTLPADEYFVMGDNRDHSSDSRLWGNLPKDKLIGKAMVRLFPPKRIEWQPGYYQFDLSKDESYE